MIKNWLRKISNKDSLMLVLLFVLIIALPLTIILVKQGQDIRSKAKVTGGAAKLYFQGPESVDPGETFSVDLYVDKGTKDISAIQAFLSYPSDLLSLEDVAINTNEFPTVVRNSYANGNIDLAVGIALSQELGCRQDCTDSSQCAQGLTCDPASSACVNPSCPANEDCVCPTPTVTSTPAPTPR